MEESIISVDIGFRERAITRPNLIRRFLFAWHISLSMPVNRVLVLLYDLGNRNLVMFLLFFIVPVFSAAPGEPDIALKYYNLAIPFYSSGDYNRAEQLLKSSIEFYTGISDSYYYLSRIYLRDNESLLRGVSFLEEAVSRDHWYYISHITAATELAHLYFRMKRYEEARDILLPFYEENETNVEGEVLLIRILEAMGDTFLRNEILVSALKEFPSEPDLYIISAEGLYKQGLVLRALNMIHTAMDLNPDSIILRFYEFKYTREPVERLILLEDYISRGGTDPRAGVIALEAFDEKRERYIKFFIDSGGSEYVGLYEEFHSLLREEEGELGYLSGYTAGAEERDLKVKYLDKNGDGYFEEVYYYDPAGNLSKLVVDDNQDLEPEMVVEFNGTPVIVRLFPSANQPAVKEYHYNKYPYLKSVIYSFAKRREKYSVIPFTRQYPYLIKRGVYRYITDDDFPAPGETEVQKYSFRKDIFDPSTGLLEKWIELKEGRPVMESRDSDGDGEPDYIVYFKNGLPTEGKRDFDGDSVFEVVEKYDGNGILVDMSFDEDGNGRPEFVQSFDKEGRVITLWDYDFNGDFDTRQVLDEGTVLYEFSTKKPFDLRVLFKNNILDGIWRDGIEVPVFKSNRKNAFWIGRRGVWRNEFQGLSPGRFNVDGKDFFLFIYNENVYIEPPRK